MNAARKDGSVTWSARNRRPYPERAVISTLSYCASPSKATRLLRSGALTKEMLPLFMENDHGYPCHFIGNTGTLHLPAMM